MAKYFASTVILSIIFALGECQFPPDMMSMLGGGGGMSSLSGMQGLGPASMGMSPFDSMMNFGSMGSAMMMGGMSNDPMMTLVMSTGEIGTTDFMVLNNLVRTIVGPQAAANAAMLVVYNSDGGLPINAVKMIPYITLMQGIAKDLKIKVPGVSGEATNEQIDQYVFQRALMWMQSRNMAGAFMELPGIGMMMMNNAMTDMQPMTAMPAPTISQPTVNQPTSSSDAARAALAKFVAASKAVAAKKKAADAGKTSKTTSSSSAAATSSSATSETKSATTKSPTLPKFDAALFAKFLASANAASGAADKPMVQETGMSFPNNMNMNTLSQMNGMGGGSGMGGMNGIGNNPMSLMAMSSMDLMGF